MSKIQNDKVLNLLNQVKRGLKKPPKVILYRAKQEFTLKLMENLGRWGKLDSNIDNYWSEFRVNSLLKGKKTLIFMLDSKEAVLKGIEDRAITKEDIKFYCDESLNREFDILGSSIPKIKWPWNSDWRFEHTWENKYFKNYGFYEKNKRKPYDIKYPWELSRLSFLIPILQYSLINHKEGKLIQYVSEVLDDWEKNNPLAYSVNWYPMEVSMRGISLSFIFELLLLHDDVPSTVIMQVVKLLTKHGEFLFRTIEYTDIRGNHYAANIVSLLIMGGLLKEKYPNARKWYEYGKKNINSEIMLQFCKDGVNFEKSIPYHRLVLELFLLGVLVLERNGENVPVEVKERLFNATVFTNYYMRPDRVAPNIGDNDNARVFNFMNLPLSNHESLLSFAATYFNEGQFKKNKELLDITVPMIFGIDGYEKYKTLDTHYLDSTRYFSSGGYLVSKNSHDFFNVDIGEVGLRGRGGHGHNDLLSFELYLNDIPLIIDPGSYMYTGDPEARNLFRSTEYHNVLRVDGKEMAELIGMWGIENNALPTEIKMSEEIDGQITVSATNTAYLRLTNPVKHNRELCFDKKEHLLVCHDIIECNHEHLVERFLHFPANVKVEIIDKSSVLLKRENKIFKISWNFASELQLVDGYVSPGYGLKEKSKILVLINQVSSNTILDFKIESLT